MPPLTWLLPIAVIPLIIAFWYDHKRNKKIEKLESKVIEINTDFSQVKMNPNVLKVKQKKSSNQLPIIYDVMLLIVTVAMFIIAIYDIHIWIIYKASFHIFGLILFIACYMVIPGVVCTITFVQQKRHIKSGESDVIAKLSFTYNADDAQSVFNRCYKILKTMGADEPEPMDKPRLLTSSLKGSFITVVIKHLRTRKYTIDVSSDAKKIATIKYDFGRNKRNINIFKKLMLSDKI